MSMFVEIFSEDVALHGDGESKEAIINLVGWPFNLDLSEAAEAKFSAYEVVGEGGVKVGVFAVSTSDDRLVIASHGLVDGDEVRFVLDDPATCALPTPLNENDVYHVVGARGNDFQVSGITAGPAINLEDRGVGSNEVWKGGGGVESLVALDCTVEGSFITMTFPEPILGGESKVVRLRAKVFV